MISRDTGKELFGVVICHAVNEVSQTPPDTSAAETAKCLEQSGDELGVIQILSNASDIGNFISLELLGGETGIDALLTEFTAPQLQKITSRLHEYLIGDISAFVENPHSPEGYPVFIERLGTYFSSGDADVTSQFSSFYDRHVDPSKNATGPLEINSRGYAVNAIYLIERQLREHYQISFEFERVGPTVDRPGTIHEWAPGVAECQFLILDCIRDFLSTDTISRTAPPEDYSMTVDDIGNNIQQLLANGKLIVDQVFAVNPDLASRVAFAINGLKEHTLEVFHRGKPGVLQYVRSPENARRAILRVEEILLEAKRQSDMEVDQEEIPVLDI